MFTPKTRSVTLACLLAGALAGCDTGGSDTAQGGEEVAEEKPSEVLTGTLDESFVGSELPEVTLTDPEGITLDLSATRGKPLLLNLWATWCAPCVVEMPLLDELAGEMGDEVRVLTVSEDLNGEDDVRAFFEEKGFENLPRWMDPNNDLAVQFGGGAVLPLTVLYDAEGRELWRVMGAYDWGSEEAIAQIREAIDNAGAGADEPVAEGSA